jgi:mRNA interferase MazF
MKRGEVWALRDDRFASKARPAVIVRSDTAPPFNSVIVCLLTTFDSSGVPTRVPVAATEASGLEADSYVMTEKVASVRPDDLGGMIGRLSEEDMGKVAHALASLLAIRPDDLEQSDLVRDGIE